MMENNEDWAKTMILYIFTMISNIFKKVGDIGNLQLLVFFRLYEDYKCIQVFEEEIGENI